MERDHLVPGRTPLGRPRTPTISITDPGPQPNRSPPQESSRMRGRLSTNTAASAIDEEARSPSPTAFVFGDPALSYRTTMNDFVLTPSVHAASKTQVEGTYELWDGNVRFVHADPSCGRMRLWQWRGNDLREGHNWYMRATEETDDSSWCTQIVHPSNCTIEIQKEDEDLFGDYIYYSTLEDLALQKWSIMREDDIPSPRSDLSRRSSVGRSPGARPGLRRRRSTRSNHSRHPSGSRELPGYAGFTDAPKESFWDLESRAKEAIQAATDAAEHADDDQRHSSSPATSGSSPSVPPQPSPASATGYRFDRRERSPQDEYGFSLDKNADADSEPEVWDGMPRLDTVTTAAETSPSTSDDYSGDLGYGVYVGEETTGGEESN